MTKADDAFRKILKNIIYIGVSIQMIFGVIWICCNFAHLQGFAGQGGKLFLFVLPALQKVYPLVYVLQLTFAFWVGMRCFSAFCFAVGGDAAKSGRSLGAFLAGAAFATFPMALQCHMAVAPFSVAGSLLLLELSLGCMLLGKREEEAKGSLKLLAKEGLLWLLMSFWFPAYCIPGAVVLLLGLLFTAGKMAKTGKLLPGILIVAALSGLLFSGAAVMGEAELLPDREQAAFAVCSRVTWPTLYPDSARWPEEVQRVLGNRTWTISLYADKMQTDLRPIMRDNFGDKAAEYYMAFAKDSWYWHKGQILRQFVGDFAGLSLSPVLLQLQLAGKGYPSYSGRNYQLMGENAPLLTKYYLRYEFAWFLIMAALSALSVLAAVCRKKGRKAVIKTMIFIVLSALLTTAFFALRGAGVMDYKLGIAVNVLWFLPALYSAAGSTERGDGKEEKI